ncbi:MAG: Hsp20/alpha crystallin family protein [Gammaproteobacteria bacterium]|nr:Hsp20/alpha crystallin family protein [Gammaproteobacteria bacterium]MBU6508718.1 Hsp20/alpha crystallin family protein [Gammaproteobacteria bacterium]MDE1983024.1 Hsp20/alpha crystallin family protein [Gammaproteobacteria bacterium]MDE2107609.1 Hsp20/alpha crystallin family protein [Gammaproteobacteria bacterium]MDE2461768.1 Hsp20/alpha crystallin family protein [Gammaproteobacteria bacterium]
MYLTRYEPRNFFRDMSEEFNRMFGGRMGNYLPADGGDLAATDWLPAVDIKEEDSRFLVRADLPGVDPKDVEITLQNGTLAIKGKRESEAKRDEQDYYRVERVYGEFFRRFTLPDSADPDKVTAKYDKGVLEIEIGKSEARKPRRITVKS